MLIRQLSLILLLVCVAKSGYAQGLLIVKEYEWDPPAKASPVEYASVERFTAVYNIDTSTGQSRRIRIGMIVHELIYADLLCPNPLFSKADADVLAARIASINDTITKWPASKPFLQAHLQADQAALAAFNRGYVLVKGKWVTRVAYQAELETAQKKALEDERHAQEVYLEKQLQVEEAQRQRGLAEAQKQAEEEKAEAEHRKQVAQTDPPAPAETSSVTQTAFAGWTLTSNGYTWNAAPESAKQRLCRSIAANSRYGNSAAFFYDALNSFYRSSDPAVLGTSLDAATTLMDAGSRVLPKSERNY